MLGSLTRFPRKCKQIQLEVDAFLRGDMAFAAGDTESPPNKLPLIFERPNLLLSNIEM